MRMENADVYSPFLIGFVSIELMRLRDMGLLVILIWIL